MNRAADEPIDLLLADGHRVSALFTRAAGAGPESWLFVYAPGAGSRLDDPFGAEAARRLATQGMDTLRFQFPYMELGRRAPDRASVLEATWRAAVERARQQNRRLVVGGRSMGGRFASMVVAQGISVDALALFAYPLHPPGRPEQTRDAHLSQIQAPSLFCSGTNDAFASPAELRELVARLPAARLQLLEGADHGFSVPKRSGRTRVDVWSEAIQSLLTFVQAI